MPVWAVLISFLVGSIVIVGAGANPVQAYLALISGAIGNQGLVATTLIKSVPLMLGGLAIAVSFRSGVFNIGVEGQIYMGALFAVWAGSALQLPAGIHLVVALSLGMLGGFLWSAIPGYLKATRGFNEVVVTIFMNYIAIDLVDYLVQGPMREPGWNYQTRAVAATARLPIILPGTDLHFGLIVALIAAGLVYLMLFHTPLGFRLRMVGSNPEAARYSGIKVTRMTVLAMAISGALAGLAGAVEISGRAIPAAVGFLARLGFRLHCRGSGRPTAPDRPVALGLVLCGAAHRRQLDADGGGLAGGGGLRDPGPDRAVHDGGNRHSTLRPVAAGTAGAEGTVVCCKSCAMCCGRVTCCMPPCG